MKLELKHLAPYLPYGLKCKSTTILFGEEDNGIYEMGLISMRGVLKGTGKPILRPLSDLTKEIADDFYNYTEPYDSFEVRVNGMTIVYRYNNKDSWREVDMSKGVSNIDKMNKHHLDYRKLIEKGLAIDINTIK